MTFKHVKFEDSSTMRSLLKVAAEKGWIKEEPLKKSASVKQTDLSPSTDLMDNILKLCHGLRSQGFDKQADDVEQRFVAFRQAQTLYQVSKEKGEDLIHDAHPQGSHKMEDVDSEEATFEDLLDKHMKTMKAVEKMPTGKLTEAHQIIDAVKVVLGQSLDETLKATRDDAWQKFMQIFGIVKQYNAAVQAKPGASTVEPMGRIEQMMLTSRWLRGDLTPATIDNAIASVQRLQQTFIPKTTPPTGVDLSVSVEAWMKMEDLFKGLLADLSQCKSLLTGASGTPALITKLQRRIKSLRAMLQDRQSFTPQDAQSGNAWLDKRQKILDNYAQVLAALEPEEKITEAKRYEASINEVGDDLEKFYQQFILAANQGG